MNPSLLFPSALLAILVLFYGGLFVLWAEGAQTAYETVIRGFGISVWPWPFFDLQGVLSWGDCHARGYDVFVYNPCDSLWRPFNYSPILLDLPLQRIGRRNTEPAGLAIDLLFLAFLPLVLRPRDGRSTLVALVACLSPTVLFAVERGNLDVLEFAMVAAAGLLPPSTFASRLSGYALYGAASLIKFYPIVLFTCLVRERPRIAARLALVLTLLCALFVTHYAAELGKLPQLMPKFHYYDLWGMRVLPLGGAGLYLGFPHGASLLLLLLLCLVMLLAAIRRASKLRAKLGPLAWDEPDLRFLAAGALVVAGCFVAASNIAYRGIFLLLLLPALITLESRSVPSLKIHFSRMLAAVLLLLWEPYFRSKVDLFNDAIRPPHARGFVFDLPSIVYFVARECLWWWLITSLCAVLILFVSDGAAVKAVIARLPMPPRLGFLGNKKAAT